MHCNQVENLLLDNFARNVLSYAAQIYCPIWARSFDNKKMGKMDRNIVGKDSTCYRNHDKQTQLLTKGILEIGAML